MVGRFGPFTALPSPRAGKGFTVSPTLPGRLLLFPDYARARDPKTARMYSEPSPALAEVGDARPFPAGSGLVRVVVVTGDVRSEAVRPAFASRFSLMRVRYES